MVECPACNRRIPWNTPHACAWKPKRTVSITTLVTQYRNGWAIRTLANRHGMKMCDVEDILRDRGVLR